MDKIIELIMNMPEYIGSNGRNEEMIENAEKKLAMKFSKEYKEYLKVIGLACFDGHELTGLCDSKRLNVVDVTNEERKNNSFVPTDWYVIENLGIDGIIIWQNEKGEIYQTIPNGNMEKIYDSLYDYIKEG